MLIIVIEESQMKVRAIVNFSTIWWVCKGGYIMVKLEKHSEVKWFPTEHIDNLSSNIEIDLTEFLYSNSEELYLELEDDFNDSSIWETKVDDYETIDHENWIINQNALEDILSIIDNKLGIPLDFSDSKIDDIFADGFELDVPVKIYSDDDDIVFRVDAPWMKVESFDDVDLYPNKLNLKSVLSMLPVTVNSKELKASFVDGEFRLEVPKKEISIEQKSKDS